MMKRCAIFLPLVLAACGEDAAAPDPGKARAVAVQQGSISDAMIPLGQLESQGPLMPREGPSAQEVDEAQPEVKPMRGVDAASASEAGEAPAPPPATAPAE